ncbi:MAG: hypothetical protein E4H14_06205 [Candidatus Thorarchaeota archaeon]|nr:MAG: hypothetical protein E4H14_06205 [Candidatus Thorarchaeota archaeon]
MSHYFVIGQMYVERLEPTEGKNDDHEVLEHFQSASTFYADSETDVDQYFIIDRFLPKEPGVYSITYAARLDFTKDYYGEVDVDIDIEWSNVERLTDKEARDTLRAFTDLTEEELQKIIPDKPEEPTFQLAEFKWLKR